MMKVLKKSKRGLFLFIMVLISSIPLIPVIMLLFITSGCCEDYRYIYNGYRYMKVDYFYDGRNYGGDMKSGCDSVDTSTPVTGKVGESLKDVLKGHKFNDPVERAAVEIAKIRMSLNPRRSRVHIKCIPTEDGLDKLIESISSPTSRPRRADDGGAAGGVDKDDEQTKIDGDLDEIANLTERALDAWAFYVPPDNNLPGEQPRVGRAKLRIRLTSGHHSPSFFITLVSTNCAEERGLSASESQMCINYFKNNPGTVALALFNHDRDGRIISGLIAISEFHYDRIGPENMLLTIMHEIGHVFGLEDITNNFTLPGALSPRSFIMYQDRSSRLAIRPNIYELSMVRMIYRTVDSRPSTPPRDLHHRDRLGRFVDAPAIDINLPTANIPTTDMPFLDQFFVSFPNRSGVQVLARANVRPRFHVYERITNQEREEEKRKKKEKEEREKEEREKENCTHGLVDAARQRIAEVYCMARDFRLCVFQKKKRDVGENDGSHPDSRNPGGGTIGGPSHPDSRNPGGGTIGGPSHPDSRNPGGGTIGGPSHPDSKYYR